MDIHEYQAKQLLSGFGVAVPQGGVAYNPEQAVYVATEMGGWHWAIKAQIHSGGRGKAGGVKLCRTYQELAAAAKSLLGSTLVTSQTGPAGKVVHRVYVEKAESFVRSMYLGFVLDRKEERIRVIASAEGGMEIEEIALARPETLLQQQVDPAVGLQAFQARELAFGLGLNIKQVNQAVTTIMACYRAFRDLDATMVEINPLVVTKDNRILALDAKMSFDDNALFRRPKITEMRDPAEEDPREAKAAEFGLNYVGLTGEIGCIINGAGLAMATMDMIKFAGGEPANFLDIGGGASPDRVAAAFNLVLSDRNIKAILVNIFAGINRCDWVAQGVIQAAQGLERAARRASRGHERRRGPAASSANADCPSSRPTRWPTRRIRPSRGARRGRGLTIMSILIDATTPVIVQGFTGEKATFHVREMIAYGTKVVGGVTPGKGGQTHLGLPGVQYRQGCGAQHRRRGQHRVRTAALCRGCTDGGGRRGLEPGLHHHRRHSGPGHDAGQALSAPLSEGKAHDRRRTELRRHHQRRQGDARHHAEQHLHSRQRRRGVALGHPRLRSGRADESLGIGVTTSVGIGGDPINGSSFLDHLMLFEQDPETKAVVMIGEIGGPQEAEAAKWVKENMSKPVVGYVAGLTAPKGRRMGHAGAIISADGDTAAEKAEIMKSYGLFVAPSPAELGATVALALAKTGSRR